MIGSPSHLQFTAWPSQRVPAGLVSCGWLRRRNTVVVLASRAAVNRTNRKVKKEEVPRQCPCGSGLKYPDCCGPIVAGAWARTAPELSRARFTALVSGKPGMLADTTHPEALDAIGTKRSLLKKIEQLMRRRGAGERPPALADCVHGQSSDDPDSWWVLLAVSFGPPGLESVYVIPELYRKDGGRWWYMDTPREFPVLHQFLGFMDQYGGPEDSGALPVQGRYAYSWLAVPPRPLPAATSAHQRGAWFSDDWPHVEKYQQGWVYLDTAVDPESGLTAAEVAVQAQRMLDASLLREPQLDWDSYYFRCGRFFQ